MSAHRTTSRGVLLAAAVAVALAGCGADPGTSAEPPTPTSPTGSPTGSPTESPTAPTAPATTSSTETTPETPPETTETTETPESEPEVSPSPEPFTGRVDPIGADLRQRMLGAGHRPGCPVDLADLRVLTVSHVDLSGAARTGRIVVAASVADDVVGVFERLYRAGWPIRSLRTIDEFGGDDDASMAQDNSSGYNCRTVAGTDRWSDHSFGTAIDLNPVENPYVTDAGIAPPAGRPYADVDRRRGARAEPGVVVADDVVVRAFADIGWEWGGTWTSSKDYQHFSLSGR